MKTLVASRLLTAMVLLGGALLTGAAQAGDETRPAPAAKATYTSKAGETLEKIATQQYPASPLQAQVLARLLLEANAPALGQTTTRKRLKSGTVLDIPSHELMLRKALSPYLPAETFQPAQHSGPEARRRWVHYP